MDSGERDPEELLRYDGFIRALARDLTGTPQEAEDLAQDAWVAALDTRARGNPARSWGGWLAGTLQRMAARGRRGAQRRRTREQRVAPADALPSAAEICAREEARRRVVEAVLGLDEAARAVLLLRYFENLPPRAIAQRLNLPVETVRTRTRRALERLRLQLDAEHGGGRAQWMAALLPWSRIPPAAPALEIAIMSAKSKILAAGMLLLLLAFLFLRKDAPQAPPGAPPELADAAQADAAGADAGAAAVGTDPQSPALERAAAAGAPAAPAASAEGRGTLIVRVVRAADGQPAPDEWLRVYQWNQPHPHFHALEARTDAQGLARFANLPAGEIAAILHRGSGRAAQNHGRVQPGEETTVDLRLERGIRIDGAVRDAAGAPVPAADVWLSDQGNVNGGHVIAQSDAHGRFTVEAVGAGHWIGARKSGYAPSPMPMILAAEGARLELVLVLSGPGGALQGRVLDSGGAPVAGAAVLIGSEQARRARLHDGGSGLSMLGPRLTTGADGRFAAEGLELGDTPVQVRAAGWGLWRGSVEIRQGAAAQLEARLEPGVRVSGRVTDAAGQPAARAQLDAGDGGFADFSARAAADGSFLLEGLPAGALQLRATSAEDEGIAATAEFIARPGELIAWNPVLGAGAEIRVRVVDEEGAPRPGCTLQLVGQTAGGEPHVEFAGTDAEGRARFGNCPDLSFELDLMPPGSATFAVRKLRDVRAGGAEIEIVLERALDPSVRMSGRLLMPDGSPAAAAILIPTRMSGSSPIETPDPATGAFALGPFPPGIWHLWVQHPTLPDHFYGPRELGPREAWNLGDLRLAAGGRLTAVFSRSTGTQGLAPELRLMQGSRMVASGLVFAQDVARSEAVAPGDYRLLWEGDGLASGSAPVSVRDGEETLLNLELRAGWACTLLVREAERTELESVEVEVREAGGRQVCASTFFRSVDASFQGVLRLAPGDYLVEARAADGRSAAGELKVGRDGESEELLLTLPAAD